MRATRNETMNSARWSQLRDNNTAKAANHCFITFLSFTSASDILKLSEGVGSHRVIEVELGLGILNWVCRSREKKQSTIVEALLVHTATQMPLRWQKPKFL